MHRGMGLRALDLRCRLTSQADQLVSPVVALPREMALRTAVLLQPVNLSDGLGTTRRFGSEAPRVGQIKPVRALSIGFAGGGGRQITVKVGGLGGPHH